MLVHRIRHIVLAIHRLEVLELLQRLQHLKLPQQVLEIRHPPLSLNLYGHRIHGLMP